MKIDNEFSVGVPVDRAWQVLTDLEGIAPCMPGAQLTGVDGDVYSGKVKIKVGPVISQYAGTAQIIEKDESTHRAVIRAKGKDSRGAGNASALINAELRAEGATTVVTVVTDLNITGKIAQFGSGMIKEVSVKLLGQFVDNLEAELHASPDGGTTDTAAAADTGTTAPAAAAPVAGAGPAAEPGTPGPRPVAPVAPSTPVPADSERATPDRVGAPRPAAGSTRPDVIRSGPERPEGRGTTTADGTGGGTPAEPSGAQATVTTGAPGGTGPVRGDTGAAGAGTAAFPGRPAGTGGPTATSAAAAPTAGGAAPSGSTASAASARPAVGASRAEPEPIDLMSLAGGSVYRRLIPVIAAVLIIAAIVVYFVVR